MFTNKIIYFPILLFLITISNIFSQPRPPSAPPEVGMRPLEMKISDDGKRIIAAYEPCTIVWDISKREILRRIPRYLSYFPSYSYMIRTINQDGSLLAVGDEQTLSLYNTENNKLVKQFAVLEQREDPNIRDSFGLSTLIGWKDEYFKQIYFTPDNKNIIVISDEDKIRYVDLTRNTISLVNVSRDPDIPRPSYQGDILDFNISHGRAVLRDNFNLIVFNIFSNQKEGEIPFKYNNMDFHPISFSINNNRNKPSVLLAGDRNYENDYLLFCDINNRKILNAKKINGRAYIVKSTADDNIVALAREDCITLFNIQNGNDFVRLDAYEEPKPPRTTQPVMTPKSTLCRTLQFGSFSSFDNALVLVKKMENEGFKPFIERTKTNNSTIWNVVINNIPEDEIQIFSVILKNAGFNDILLMQEKSETRQ